jgi:DNA polymerase-4
MPTIQDHGLTLIGVAFSNLESEDAVQLTLPFGRRESAALDTAVDELRDRFGSSAVTRGTLLGRDAGPTVPLLPD